MVDVYCGDVSLQLSSRRLTELRQLYGAAHGAAISASDATVAANEDVMEVSQPFGRALMALLLRYQSLDGGSCQWRLDRTHPLLPATLAAPYGWLPLPLTRGVAHSHLPGGFQCALPAAVFTCLQKQWGVDIEAFASPLNATLGANHFCSAFPDVDAPFGSRGSFFDLCAQSHWQFDSLERAHYSTMMVLALVARGES